MLPQRRSKVLPTRRGTVLGWKRKNSSYRRKDPGHVQSRKVAEPGVNQVCPPPEAWPLDHRQGLSGRHWGAGTAGRAC